MAIGLWETLLGDKKEKPLDFSEKVETLSIGNESFTGLLKAPHAGRESLR